MRTVEWQIEHLKSIIAKRNAKGFDNTDKLERLMGLEGCLHDEHEYTEAIDISTSGNAGKLQLRCLWCDKVKQ